MTVLHEFYDIFIFYVIKTFQRTPWNVVLFEELLVALLVKKLPRFLWDPKVHYRVRITSHWTQSWARWIQFMPSYPVY